ncbi:MAG: Rpn family recombination-promoting nuclease/putative transposase [Lachnospiraceae bacterium]|nr:Rpn family recombination-promoting nuclease/putative transposase [Lachnospiraceae bacterium]
MGLLPMGADILPPSDDRVFKLILTPLDAKPVLIDLVSSIIKRPVLDVEVRNNDIPPSDTEEKAERLDVNCRIDDGSQIDLEMQASRIQEDSDGRYQNLKGKSIYYLCDLHSSQPSRGVRRYDRLSRTYQVTFCSYTVFPNRSDYVNSFSLRHDEDNELLSDAIQVVYVELSKLQEIMKKSVDDMTDLEKWAVFFQYASEPNHRETVNKVIASKEVLQMAGNRLMNISQDERERAVFRSRRMFQTDMQSDLATAEDRGERRGRAEGRAEGVLSAIQSLMDSMGLSVDQAMNVLKISETDRPKYRSMLSGQ